MHEFTATFLKEIRTRAVFLPITNKVSFDAKDVDEATVFLDMIEKANDVPPKEKQNLNIIAEAASCAMDCADHFKHIQERNGTVDGMVNVREHIGKLKPLLEDVEVAFQKAAKQLTCTLFNIHALALAYIKNFEEAKVRLTEGLTYSNFDPTIQATLSSNLDRIKIQAAESSTRESTALLLVAYRSVRGRSASTPTTCSDDLVSTFARLEVNNRRQSLLK